MRVWPDASGLEANWCAGITWPSFWQEATGPLPVSHFQTRFHSSTDVPDNTVQNQPRSDLVLAECVRFWPNHSGLEASWCARIIPAHFWPMLPSRSRLDANWIRHVYLENSLKTTNQKSWIKILNTHKKKKKINRNSLKTTSQSSIKTTTKNHPSFIQNHQSKFSQNHQPKTIHLSFKTTNINN